MSNVFASSPEESDQYGYASVVVETDRGVIDLLTPEEARTLAANLIQAADFAEGDTEGT